MRIPEVTSLEEQIRKASDQLQAKTEDRGVELEKLDKQIKVYLNWAWLLVFLGFILGIFNINIRVHSH